MGFSYGYNGLCCDFCDKDDPQLNVKKIPCPYGFCQAWACCNKCFKQKKHLSASVGIIENGKLVTKSHKDHCKQASIDFDKKQSMKIGVLRIA